MFPSAFIALKPIKCIKTRFFARNNAFLANLTSFSLKNALKRKKKFVSAQVGLNLHNSMRLHVCQCFYSVKTDKVHKTRFLREMTRFSAFNVVFAEKRVKTQKIACFSAS